MYESVCIRMYVCMYVCMYERVLWYLGGNVFGVQYQGEHRVEFRLYKHATGGIGGGVSGRGGLVGV